MRNVLFVCSRDRLRSPTAEAVFSGYADLEVASAGLNRGADVELTPEDIGGHAVTFGIPAARPLTPAGSLYARCITIKNFVEPEPFLDAARRQVVHLGVAAMLELPRDGQARPRRRILSIKRNKIVGFSVAAHDLSDDDSLLLQVHGIGGRRAMGCGIFNAIVNSTTNR